MVIFKKLYRELDNLIRAREYWKGIDLIDTELKSKLDIESRSMLLAMKGKVISMSVFNTKPEGVRTTSPPIEVSVNKQIFGEAITCFDKSIELKPDNGFAYENKGLALARKGDFEEAIKCGKAALDINPTNFTVLSQLSKWYKDLGEFKESIIYADKVIQNKNMASKNQLISSYFNKSRSQFSLIQRDYIHSMENAIELESDPEKKESYLKLLQEMKDEFNSK